MGSLSKLPPEVARELRRHVSPRPLQQMADATNRTGPQLAAEQQRSSGWVLAGCLVFTGAAFSIPFVAQKWIGNLNGRDQPLTHAQIRRGAFLNSGSTDAGKDPSWDFRHGQYKKDDNYWAIFDNNAVGTAFGKIASIGKTDKEDLAPVEISTDKEAGD